MTVDDTQLASILAQLGARGTAPVADQARNAGSTPPPPWCRADCGAPLDETLIDREDNSGLHPSCTQPVDTAVDNAAKGYQQTIVTLDETHVRAAFDPDNPGCAAEDCGGSRLDPCASIMRTKGYRHDGMPPAVYCNACDTDTHICGGCGEPLGHDETCRGRDCATPVAVPYRVSPPGVSVDVQLPDPGTPPPSTIAELRRVLIDFEAQRPRSMQTRLGPSELGTPCQQQIARKLAGAPRQPITAPTWAPFQGTAVHASMEEVVAFWNRQLGRERWLAEDDLEADPGMEGVEKIAGHGDAFDTDWACVVDWKHVGTTALDKLRAAKRAGKPAAEQVSAEYRVQGHIYGLGHQRKGRDVKFVRLVLLARSWQYDDSEEWTEAYDPEIAHAAIARYYATHDLLNGLDVKTNPDFVAAVPASPSPDACKWCPFHRLNQPSDWGGCKGAVDPWA